jgi:hypothetical protein
MADRALAIDNARYIATSLADFGSDIEFREGGIMNSEPMKCWILRSICLQSIRKTVYFEPSKKDALLV